MYCIGIAGGTASGKTTFVKLLKQSLAGKNVNFITIDDYYKSLNHLSIEERNEVNFDHPNAIDFDLLEEHIKQLLNGEAFEKPEYCFKTHDRLTSSSTVNPTKVTIIEGILGLSVPEIRNLCDYKIFIDTPEEIRLERRLIRDINERGRTKENVISQLNKTTIPMHKQFVEPSKQYADFIVDGTKNLTEAVQKICDLINEQLY